MPFANAVLKPVSQWQKAMELFLRMVGEGKLPNKQTINILMELLDEAGQFSKVGVPQVQVHGPSFVLCTGSAFLRRYCAVVSNRTTRLLSCLFTGELAPI